MRAFLAKLTVAGLAILCACGRFPAGEASLDDIDAVMTMQLRPDGRYDVICEDGSREIVTSADIRNNDVCPNSSNNEPTHIISVQRRSDGLFNVICDDLRHLTVTGHELVHGDVCAPLEPEIAKFRSLCESRFSESQVYQLAFDFLLAELAEENCDAAAVRAMDVKVLALHSWNLHPDMAPFAALPRLETIVLDAFGPESERIIPDFSPLAQSPSFQKIRLGGKSEPFMGELSKLPNLKSLEGISTLADLSFVPQVEELSATVNLTHQTAEPLETMPNLKSLTVRLETGLIHLPKLKSFSKLVTLTVRRSYVPDPEKLARELGLDVFQETTTLKHLTTDIMAIDTISKIQSLESLTLIAPGWRDLTPISQLKSLQWLSVQDAQPEDFPGIVQLAEKIPLRSLKLDLRSQIALDGLEQLKDLEELVVNYIYLKNPTADLTAISNLPGLRRLIVSGNSGDEFIQVKLGSGPMSSKVAMFGCYKCILSDPTELSVFSSLETLILWPAKNIDLAFLKAPEQLKRISIVHSEPENVHELARAINLEYLDMIDSKIDSLDFLLSTPKVKDVRITAPDLQSTHSLSALSNLEKLAINVLDPLPTLPNLKRLKSLVVSGPFNQSHVGEGLRMPFLRSLSLRGGNMASFNSSAFPRIRGIELTGSRNTISEFPDLKLMPQLSDFRIYNSQISEVPSLRGTRLRLLYLTNSNVHNLNFDGEPLTSLTIDGLTKISHDFVAPNMRMLQAGFAEGVPATAENCPLDHSSPAVVSLCKHLIGRVEGSLPTN